MSSEKQNILAECIRRSVAAWFERLGAASNPCIAETLLIRNGYFCGRRYRAEHLEAVWFFEENQLKIYGADGAVARVFDAASLLSGETSEAA